MEIRSAVTLARDGLEEGNRVIASKLNAILSVRCPELRIKCEEVLPGDSMQSASSKLKNAWHYLGTRVRRVDAIMPWTIGLLYPGPSIKEKDGRSAQDNVLWLIDVNGYLDQEMFDILERETQWTLADWQAIVVSPFEEHHLQWERYLDSILDSLSLAENQNVAQERIPKKYRSRPMPKKEAINFIGWPTHCQNERQALRWFSQSIKDGEYPCEELNKKSYVFDVRKFPVNAQKEMRAI